MPPLSKVASATATAIAARETETTAAALARKEVAAAKLYRNNIEFSFFPEETADSLQNLMRGASSLGGARVQLAGALASRVLCDRGTPHRDCCSQCVPRSALYLEYCTCVGAGGAEWRQRENLRLANKGDETENTQRQGE